MRVSFWFDPVCPFCWITSRWIREVATERDLEIDWQPISLFFKNDPEPGTPFYEPTVKTRNLLRVVESLRAGGQTDRIGAFYTELGRKIHHEKTYDFDVARAAHTRGRRSGPRGRLRRRALRRRDPRRDGRGPRARR